MYINNKKQTTFKKKENKRQVETFVSGSVHVVISTSLLVQHHHGVDAGLFAL